MSLTRLIKTAHATACLLMLSAATLAYGGTADQFEQRIQAQRLTEKKLQDELRFTSLKRREAEAALAGIEAELSEKQAQLRELQKKYQEPLTKAQKELLENEQQRLALSELAIKSRVAAVVRLGRKEEELEQQIAGANKLIAELQSQQKANLRRAQQDAEAKSRALAAQLEALQKENETLRLAMEEEARRAAAAQEEAERLAQQTLADEAAAMTGVTASTTAEAVAATIESPEAPAAALTADLEPAREPVVTAALTDMPQGQPSLIPFAPSTYAPPPQVWMFEELPDSYEYSEEEEAEEAFLAESLREAPEVGKDTIVMRSRNIDRPVKLTSAGDELYRATVEVSAGRAYFNLGNRRYRGEFPQSDNNVYVFTYDMSQAESPRLTIEKAAADTAVAGEAAESY